MVDLEPTTRERAIEDGLIVDVSELARSLGIPCPTAVSAGLLHDPDVGGDLAILKFIISSGVGTSDWFTGHYLGDLTYAVAFEKPDNMAFVEVRLSLERAADGSPCATFCLASERYDLRCPRVGSMFVM